MSSGHSHIGHVVGLSEGALRRVLDNRDVQERLFRQRKIDRTYDMPYVGGYSTDGNTIFIDRHLPDQIEMELDGNSRTIDTESWLAGTFGHEPVEWSVMDAIGWQYGPAHEVATAAEKRRVLMLYGPQWWKPYQDAWEPFVKKDEHEKLVRMPKDFDTRPLLYPPVDERLLACVQRAMGQSAGQFKASKAEAKYGAEGKPNKHCGRVRGWTKDGDCAHFIKPNSCMIVLGYISPKGWCDEYWEAKSGEHEESEREERLEHMGR